MREMGIGLLFVAAGVSAACSQPAGLVGQGGMCLRFEDCDPKYVCVHNICTNDLDGLVSFEPVDTGSDAYSSSDSAPPADGYAPDAYTPDANAPSDAAATETGSPPSDGAQQLVEAGP